MPTPPRGRRLWDTYRFPGFRPHPTVTGIFGDPHPRVIILVRRSKTRPARTASGMKSTCGSRSSPLCYRRCYDAVIPNVLEITHTIPRRALFVCGPACPREAEVTKSRLFAAAFLSIFDRLVDEKPRGAPRGDQGRWRADLRLGRLRVAGGFLPATLPRWARVAARAWHWWEQ